MKSLSNSLLFVLISIGLTSCAATKPPKDCPSSEILGATTFISSDGQAIDAVYCDNGTVSIAFSDGSKEVLTQAVSASGARYTSENHQWWEHHGEATYSVDDEKVFVGKQE